MNTYMRPQLGILGSTSLVQHGLKIQQSRYTMHQTRMEDSSDGVPESDGTWSILEMWLLKMGRTCRQSHEHLTEMFKE